MWKWIKLIVVAAVASALFTPVVGGLIVWIFWDHFWDDLQ